jgi:catechol 2,3-dioxygenase-like lactoylglutathione lyase family enzyme
MAAMIGRLHHVILDGPDPAALATFYSELLGLPVTYRSDDFVVVSADGTSSGWRSSSRPITSRRPGRIQPGRSKCISTSWWRT